MRLLVEDKNDGEPLGVASDDGKVALLDEEVADTVEVTVAVAVRDGVPVTVVVAVAVAVRDGMPVGVGDADGVEVTVCNALGV